MIFRLIITIFFLTSVKVTGNDVMFSSDTYDLYPVPHNEAAAGTLVFLKQMSRCKKLLNKNCILAPVKDVLNNLPNTENTNWLRNISKSVGLLKIEFQTNSGKRFYQPCTANLINRNLIITARHCFYPTAEFTNSIRLRGDVAFGVTDGLPSNRNTYKVNINYIVEEKKELDYIVLKLLPHKNTDNIPHISFNIRNPLPNEDLLILGHPGAQIQFVSNLGCKIDKILKDSVSFSHKCDTFGGSSGSLVFSAADHSIVGIHHSSSGNGNNLASKIIGINEASNVLNNMSSVMSRPPDYETDGDPWSKDRFTTETFNEAIYSGIYDQMLAHLKYIDITSNHGSQLIELTAKSKNLSTEQQINFISLLTEKGANINSFNDQGVKMFCDFSSGEIPSDLIIYYREKGYDCN